jgi:serine/threonine protein kinase
VAGEASDKRTQIGGTGAPSAPLLRAGSNTQRPSLAAAVAMPSPSSDDGEANDSARPTEFSQPPEPVVAAAAPTASPPAAAPAVAPPTAGSTPPRAAVAKKSSPRVTAAQAAAMTSAEALVGKVLADRYEIHQKLGEGGMGAVYLATHTMLEKRVALKILHGEYARKADLVERFIQEAKSASRIRHENVIDISDFGVTDEGLVFFAMELLEGHDLHAEIVRAKKAKVALPWERSRKIFLQICAALSAAHAQGVIHRDLKPENIYLVEFLGNKDFVKLLDFGIAKLVDDTSDGERKLTKTGMLFGTPEYMSPEQARGEPVDHRVDIYAMGCILHQLLTGRVPFEADNFMGILSLHLTEELPPMPIDTFAEAGAPPEIGPILEKALAKQREDRWQTIDEMANAVRALHGEAPVEAAPVAVPTVPPKAPPAGGIGAGRSRTEWKGSPQVPLATMAGVPVPRKKSLAPWILAIAVGGAGAAAAVYFATRSAPAPAAAPVAVASGAPVAGSAGATPAGTSTTSAPLPAQVTVSVDSKPSRATVYQQLANGEWSEYGKTPLSVIGPGSRELARYKLELAGYSARIIALPMDKDGSLVEELVPLAGTTALPEVTGSKPGTVTAGTKPDDRPDKPEGKPGGDKPGDKPEAKPGGDKPEVKPGGDKPEVKTGSGGGTGPGGIRIPDWSQFKDPPKPAETGSGS